MLSLAQAISQYAPSLEQVTMSSSDELREAAEMYDFKLTVEGYLDKVNVESVSETDLYSVKMGYAELMTNQGLRSIPLTISKESLVAELTSTMDRLNGVSMEGIISKGFVKAAHGLKNFISDYTNNLNALSKDVKDLEETYQKKSVFIHQIEVYRFFSKDGKMVKNVKASIKDEEKFFDLAEEHCKKLTEEIMEMNKVFRQASTSGSVEGIRDGIDFFDTNLADRQRFKNLDRFKLLGNREIVLDNRGAPKVERLSLPIEGTGDTFKQNLVNMIAKGKSGGIVVGKGFVKGLVSAEGLSSKETYAKLLPAMKSHQSELQISDVETLIDQARSLKRDHVKFQQMTDVLNDRVKRMEYDMQIAYDKAIEALGEGNGELVGEVKDLWRAANRAAGNSLIMAKLLTSLMSEQAEVVYKGMKGFVGALKAEA